MKVKRRVRITRTSNAKKIHVRLAIRDGGVDAARAVSSTVRM